MEVRKIKGFMGKIPCIFPENRLETEDNGLKKIFIGKEGFLENATKPASDSIKIREIELDEFGSFIIGAIDGKRNVEEINNMANAEFEENEDPLDGSTGKFLEMLLNEKVIYLSD